MFRVMLQGIYVCLTMYLRVFNSNVWQIWPGEMWPGEMWPGETALDSLKTDVKKINISRTKTHIANL